MTAPMLVDAVTLRHFAVAGRLSVLENVLSTHPGPRWTETVRSEILAGIGRPDCDDVLAASFLGAPHQIPTSDLADVMKIRIALSGAGGRPDDHLGEAESIFVADKFHGAFITDDNAAFDFARRRLGNMRVFDTVDLLRKAVGLAYFTASEAQQVADAIRNAGRKLRRVHASTFTPEYFS